MINISNYEMYRCEEHQHYQKELNILQHINLVNACINELHTEPEKLIFFINRVKLTKRKYDKFENES